MNTKNQMKVYLPLLGVYGVIVFASTWIQIEQAASQPAGTVLPPMPMPAWLMGLASAGMVLVAYGLLGFLGYWLARKLGLPGIFRAGAGWKGLFWKPMAWGLALGAVMMGLDRLFSALSGVDGLAHPTFPLSLLASFSAGVGEEILFRLFVMSLWAFLLNLILRRWKLTSLAVWIANGIAALGFIAGHLPAAMVLAGVSSPAEIPALMLVEIFVLNGLCGLLAGWQYQRNGLVAASGVHFWADILWHVIFPLILGV